MLHCTLSFVKNFIFLSLSLSTFLIHLVLALLPRTRGKSWTGSIDPWTWASKLRTEVEEPREPRDTLLRLLFPASTRRFPRSFRSARVPIPLDPPPPLHASLSPFPFCFPARFRPLHLLEKLRAAKSAMESFHLFFKYVNNYDWLIIENSSILRVHRRQVFGNINNKNSNYSL